MSDWLQNIRVDGFSFFLGVAAGTLFWALFTQFKGWIPRLLGISKQIIQNFRERNFAGIDAAIRLDALKKAEKSHIAANLFPLDDILILPKLLASPALIDPSQPRTNEFLITEAFPYTPDWPELASQCSVGFISLGQAIQQNANLVIIGQPGCGKTTALAHLAIQLARKDPALGPMEACVPFFIHIEDALPQIILNPAQPLQAIIKSIANRLPIFAQNQMTSFVKLAIPDGRIILLLDGLDELPSALLKEVVKYLRQILTDNPKLHLITTGSATYLDGLIELGFQPISLAAWNVEERQNFIEKWGKLWKDKISPEITRRAGPEQLEPVFINNWINPNQIHLTPLDWTLNLWSIYAGQNGNTTHLAPMHEYVNRSLVDTALYNPISMLALDLVKGHKPCFVQEDLDILSAKKSMAQIKLYDPNVEPIEPSATEMDKMGKEKGLVNPTPWLSALVQTGLVIEHPGRVFRFCHPAVTAYLAASASSEMDLLDMLSEPESWEIQQLVLANFCGLSPDKMVLPDDWLQGAPPTYRKPLMVGRWIKFIPINHAIRAKVLKRMVDGMLDETSLLSTRYRFCTALMIANDPSLPVIFRQLLNAPGATIRSLASLALGVLRDEKSISPITTLLADPVDTVRRDACVAISSIRSKTAFEILEECLSAEDEILRQTSAEALAGIPKDGHDLLKQAAQSENLLVRRSVMFGLSRIREIWSQELLGNIAVQDGQWVVRNAASQALEILQKPDPVIPYPLTPPSETPWLLAFASKSGQGISIGDSAQEVLLQALQAGSDEEKLAALQYLRNYSDEKVISTIFSIAVAAEPPVNLAAQLALWYINVIRPDAVKIPRSSMRY